MVRSQDGGISCQVLKIVHDDCHEQVEHLSEKEKSREKGKWGKGSTKGSHVKMELKKELRQTAGAVLEKQVLQD